MFAGYYASMLLCFYASMRQITLPGSKSLSNRVLLLSALSEGTTKVENLLDSADIRYMLGALKDLKIPLDEDKDAKTVVITGRGGPINVASKTELFLGNAGTAMRPLAGVLCGGEGEFVLDGVARMRERPIKDLIDGLVQLGVDVSCSDTGCPPVSIKAKGIQGGTAEISGQISSQFLSALLMTGPLAKKEIVLKITDELMSAPYVHMTMNLMRKFGVTVTSENDKVFRVQPGKYKSPKQIFIEGDASSASYFLAGAAITGGPVTVYGCGSESVQGDARFAQVLEKMGATVSYTASSITVSRDLSKPLIGVDEDCGDIPDVAMTLAVVGMFAQGKTKIRNVYNWRVKETERMVAMVNELTKLGVTVEEGRDYLVVEGLKPGQKLNANVEIETYDDHRVAMCFALAACGGVPVTILDPGCTSKTFPDYFEKLAGMTRR
jgi:3-phosphoshikimate 1-carboxyvinyltransferase